MIDLVIELPSSFLDIVYPKENKNYYLSNIDSKNLFKEILNKSNYFCMYCGTNMSNGNTHGIQGTFEKEHAIEKIQIKDTEDTALKQCKFNFGTACGACNRMKAKSLVKLSNSDLAGISLKNCEKRSCLTKCAEYELIYLKYCKDNKTILKPFGYAIDPEKPLIIEYDLLAKNFNPSRNYNYSQPETYFIQNHIQKLQLNNRNLNILSALLLALSQKIDSNKAMTTIYKKAGNFNLHPNLIDNLFIDFLLELPKKQKKMVIKRLYANESYK